MTGSSQSFFPHVLLSPSPFFFIHPSAFPSLPLLPFQFSCLRPFIPQTQASQFTATNDDVERKALMGSFSVWNYMVLILFFFVATLLSAEGLFSGTSHTTKSRSKIGKQIQKKKKFDQNRRKAGRSRSRNGIVDVVTIEADHRPRRPSLCADEGKGAFGPDDDVVNDIEGKGVLDQREREGLVLGHRHRLFLVLYSTCVCMALFGDLTAWIIFYPKLCNQERASYTDTWQFYQQNVLNLFVIGVEWLLNPVPLPVWFCVFPLLYSFVYLCYLWAAQEAWVFYIYFEPEEYTLAWYGVLFPCIVVLFWALTLLSNLKEGVQLSVARCCGVKAEAAYSRTDDQDDSDDDNDDDWLPDFEFDQTDEVVIEFGSEIMTDVNLDGDEHTRAV
jgi:hypothetical protein